MKALSKKRKQDFFISAIAVGLLSSIPALSPVLAADAIADQPNLLAAPVGGESGVDFSVSVRNGPGVLKGFNVWSGEWIDGIQLIYKNKKNGSLFSYPDDKIGGAGGKLHTFVFQPNDRVTAIRGTYKSDYIRSLQFFTTTKSSPIYGKPDGREFYIEISKDHIFQGFVGRHASYLNALGVLAIPKSVESATKTNDSPFSDFGQEAMKPEMKVAGTWIKEGFHYFEKNRNFSEKYFAGGNKDILNGNYLSPEYYIIRSADNSGLKVNLYIDSLPSEVGTYVSTDGEYFEAEKAINGVRHFSLNMTASKKNRIRINNNLDLIHPETTDAELKKTVSEEKVSFQDAWLVDKIPIGITYSFAGYDIVKMNPFNLLEHRSAAPIFRPSSTKAYDFNNHKIVPYGLRYYQDTENETFFTETVISSEREVQESSSYSFGMSVDVKGKASKPSADKKQGGPKGAAGFNYAKKESKGMKDGSNEMKSYGVAYVQEYVLTLDKGFMELSTAFKDMVDDVKRGQKRPKALIDAFGTHYPHAVTYGAMAKSSMSFKAKDLADWSSSEESVSGQVTIPVKALEVTPSGGWTKEKSASIKSSSSVRIETFKAVGGNGSWGKEGFQGSETRVVPVLMDLRPIFELLGPLYFDDEEILRRVRPSVEKAWDTYLAGFKTNTTDTTPDIYHIIIDGLFCVNDGGESGNTEEYFGTISINYPNGNAQASLDLLKADESAAKDGVCDGKTAVAGTKKVIPIYVEPQFRANALFSILGLLQESDSSPDADDFFPPVPPIPQNIETLANGKDRVIDFKNGEQHAKLVYRIEKIKIK